MSEHGVTLATPPGDRDRTGVVEIIRGELSCFEQLRDDLVAGRVPQF